MWYSIFWIILKWQKGALVSDIKKKLDELGLKGSERKIKEGKLRKKLSDKLHKLRGNPTRDEEDQSHRRAKARARFEERKRSSRDSLN